MGKLIATTQATVDGVIDPVGEWVDPDGDHGEYSFERQARSSGLVLGRKTYEGWRDTGRASRASGHGQPAPEVRGVQQPVRELEWNATLLEGDLEDAIPSSRTRSTVTCSCIGAASSRTPSPRRA